MNITIAPCIIEELFYTINSRKKIKYFFSIMRKSKTLAKKPKNRKTEKLKKTKRNQKGGVKHRISRSRNNFGAAPKHSIQSKPPQEREFINREVHNLLGEYVKGQTKMLVSAYPKFIVKAIWANETSRDVILHDLEAYARLSDKQSVKNDIAYIVEKVDELLRPPSPKVA